MYKNVKLKIEDIQPNLRFINLYQCESKFNSGFRKLYNYYFLYVHKGKGSIAIDDKTYESNPGDLYFCPPGVPNAIIADGSDPFLLSGIDFDFTLNHITNNLMYPIQSETFNPLLVTEFVNFENFSGFPERVNVFGDESIREILNKMIKNFNTRKKHWKIYCNSLLHTFIIELVQRIEQNASDIFKPGKADKILAYLSDNFSKDLTNKELSKLFHYNPDYISKVVLSYTGVTIRQYIIDLRIRTALSYLTNSNMSIKDIAALVGYENIHYFTRIFKNKTGFPPGYFRKKHLPQKPGYPDP